MNLSLFIALLFGLQVFYWFIGKRSSKNLSNNEDYFLAGKKVSFFPLMMTFLATQVGGGLVLGACDEAYRFGWLVTFYPLGASCGLLFLGAGMGRRLAEFPASTVAQVLEIVYQSRGLRKVASLLSVLSLFMILVAQIIASHKFLISLGFDNSFLFVLFWAVVILYTVQGGLKAVISTDIVQAAFFSGVFLFCLAFLYFFHPLPKLESASFEMGQISLSKLSGWLLMPLLFMIIEQDMGQRCFAGGSTRTVSKAAFWAGLFTLIICIVPIYLGVLAKSLGVEIPQGASVLMTVIGKTTNPTVSALVGCAVLAAIISTATSLINAISSNLSSDFKIELLQGKHSIRNVKILTAIISICSIFFAFYFDNVVDLLIQSYELSVSALFVPIFLGLFRKKGNFISALLSILLGSFGFCLSRLIDFALPKEILTLLISFSGYLLGEMIALRKKANTL